MASTYDEVRAHVEAQGRVGIRAIIQSNPLINLLYVDFLLSLRRRQQMSPSPPRTSMTIMVGRADHVSE